MLDQHVVAKDEQSDLPLSRAPRVSIGMPVYNGMPFIGRAVRSILDQTHKDFELIIIDNASTDGSFEYACRLNDDPRIRVERNDYNIGAVKNFIKVLELARGEFFMWAPIDDMWDPQFVARLMAELDQHPNAAVAMSAAQRVAEDRQLKGIVRFVKREDPQHMRALHLALEIGSTRKYNYFINGLFRRPLLLKLATYFPEGGAPERILLTHLALQSKFRYVDEVLYFRTEHRLNHEERYPDEPYARTVAKGLNGDLEFLRSLFFSLVGSQDIPWRRKFYSPIIVARFAATRFFFRFRHSVGRPAWRFFKRLARRLWRNSTVRAIRKLLKRVLRKNRLLRKQLARGFHSGLRYSQWWLRKGMRIPSILARKAVRFFRLRLGSSDALPPA